MKKIRKEPYADITKEDIEKSVNEFWDKNKMNFPVKVTDLGNGMVEISTKGAWGRFPKQKWNEALIKSSL